MLCETISQAFLHAGMPEQRVQRVQVHPMPFVFITFWVQCGRRLYGCNGRTKDFKRIGYIGGVYFIIIIIIIMNYISTRYNFTYTKINYVQDIKRKKGDLPTGRAHTSRNKK